MALTKVTGYSGEAELLGSLRSVQYAGGMLTICGVALEESYALLDVLAAKAIKAVRVKAKEEEDWQVPAEEPGSKATPPESPAAKAKTALEKKARAEREARELNVPPKKEAEEPKTPAEKASTAAPENDEPPWVKEGTEPKAETQAAGGEQTPPPEVAKSGRFIEVLNWVMQAHGLKPTQVDEIVAECEKLKELPAVRRVRDLRDKVEANLAAYAEEG